MGRPRNLPADEYEELVVTATLSLIAEGGPAHATMANIAQRAGVGYGSLYRSFANRAQILQRAIDVRIDRVRAEWAEAELVPDPLDRIVALLLAPLRRSDDLDALRLVFGYPRTGAGLDPAIEAQAVEVLTAGTVLLERSVAEAKTQGYFGAFADPRQLVGTLVTLLSQPFLMTVGGEHMDWPAAASHLEHVARHLAAPALRNKPGLGS